MSFPRHAKYKPSVVEWLGDVPDHWTIKKMRDISSLKGRLGWQGLKADEYLDEGPYVVSSAHFDNYRVLWDDCPSVSQERYNIDSNIQLADGDVLLMKDGAALGKLAFLDNIPGPACLNSHLLLLRPIVHENISYYMPKYSFFYMQTDYFQEYMKINGTGATFLGVSQETIGRYLIALPPVKEQQAIIDFLDYETAKIEALVADHERLIALLQEKRLAVISHAVTKGLDPDAPMKESGVEWLGKVPEHWQLTKVKRVGSIKYGIGEPPKYHTEGTQLIRATNVDAGFIRSEGMVFIDPSDLPEGRAIWLRAGDIIVVRSGAYTADSAIIREDHLPAIAGFDMVVRPFGCHPEFLQYALLSFYLKNRQLDAEKLRAAQPHLNAAELGAAVLLLPAAKEQAEIARYLNEHISRIDLLISEAERAIALLQERRSALISAAVTGKIDVRGLVAADAEAA